MDNSKRLKLQAIVSKHKIIRCTEEFGNTLANEIQIVKLHKDQLNEKRKHCQQSFKTLQSLRSLPILSPSVVVDITGSISKDS